VNDEPRRCARCNRLTNTWIARPIEEDRGPLEVVWCENAAACEQYRATLSPQSPRRVPH
jgi:hypothetical protein